MVGEHARLRTTLADAASVSLGKRYRQQLDSHIADTKRIGSEHPGAITATLFLAEFVYSHTPQPVLACTSEGAGMGTYWSDYDHHISGLFVVIMAMLALASRTGWIARLIVC